MTKLGVNIDHVATLRQARREEHPDPILAAAICEKSGANSIIAHLREDRRHIQDLDVKILRTKIKSRFNLEMSVAPEIIKIALKILPDQVTFVPERRQEITTEGGLDVVGQAKKIANALEQFGRKKITASLFIDPDVKQIQKTKAIGATHIELHTGTYAQATKKKSQIKELKKLDEMTQFARSIGLTVSAGHGLNYENAKAVAAIDGMEELNIGHSIISRAVFVGLEKAVKEMMELIH